MTTRSLLRLALSLVCALLALSVIWLVLERPSVQAGPLNAPGSIRTYPGSGACSTTLQACISASADGDTVLVSPGTYVTASLSITRAVNLIGAGANPAGVKLRPTSGRVIQYNAATITNTTVISNLTVENGNAGGSDGGGIRVLGGSGVPLFYSIVVSNNIGTGGGGIRINPIQPVTMVNVTVFSNTSMSLGGGILLVGDLTVINSRIEHNSAAGDGGGIHTLGALAITNTLFGQNVASGSGGSIYAGSNVTVTLEGTSSVSRTTISNSSANTNGGGIYAAGSVKLVGEVFFNGNNALNGEGGAIYTNDLFDSAGNSSLLDLTFIGNTAKGNGGAIRALGDVRLLNRPSFQSSKAGGGTTANGGAIFADGDVYLSRGASSVNIAKNGGGVYAKGAVTFDQHSMINNAASENGGCAYAERTVTYSNADAIFCVAGLNGGAAFAVMTVTVSGQGQNQSHDNRAGNGGGVAFANVVVMRGAALFSNTAKMGGALVATKTLDIANSAFTTNTAANFGGAGVSISGTALITNSIFTNNQVTGTNSFGGAVWVTGTATISSSTFMSNTAPGLFANSGAVGASSRVTLLGGSFQGNGANTGGAVLSRADVIATGTSFTDNGSLLFSGSGGGIVAITTTLNTVTMTKNRVCCSGSNGGAISATLAFISNSVFIQNSAGISGGAVIATRVFITGSQFISNTGFASEGGGVWTEGGAITNTQFIANETGCCSSKFGGALYTRGQIFVHGSQFVGNQAGGGGAIFIKNSGGSSEIHDSTFTDNLGGGGGAIDAHGFGPFIYNSTFTGNRVDSRDGGAIRADEFLYVEQSTFSNNKANGQNGGAIFMPNVSGVFGGITASTFISNFAEFGGGALNIHNFSVNNSTFISNHVGSFGNGGAVASSGGIVLDGDSFTNNSVDALAGGCGSGLGGAVYVPLEGGFLQVFNSAFAGGSAPRGGAIFAASGATVDTSTFSDNSAVCLDSVTLSNIGFGGAIASQQSLTVNRSSFVHNSAGSVGGGAIAYIPSTAKTLRVENSLFARNVATNTVFGAHGAAIVVSNTNTSQLFFNTVANGGVLNGVSAIAVYSGTASVIDSIVANHLSGIERLGGTVFEDHNEYFANGAPTSGGVTSGGSSFTANPLFVSPATDDYHLGAGSPALDVASDLGISVDFDGDTRPIGAGFDIGFDERNAAMFKLYLPLIMR